MNPLDKNELKISIKVIILYIDTQCTVDIFR